MLLILPIGIFNIGGTGFVSVFELIVRAGPKFRPPQDGGEGGGVKTTTLVAWPELSKSLWVGEHDGRGERKPTVSINF